MTPPADPPPDPPGDPAPSKGMAMIASYRAERLGQRSVLRGGLHQGRMALRQGRQGRQGRHPPPEPGIDAPVPSPPPEAAAPPVQEASSVFAGLVSLAVAERENEAAGAAPPPDVPPPDVAAPHAPPGDGPAGPEAVALPSAEPPPPDDSRPDLPPDPPLAEIGFGPGMLIRLSQVGLRTIGDLARANPTELRQALGDISRLVDVETWINNARENVAARG